MMTGVDEAVDWLAPIKPERLMIEIDALSIDFGVHLLVLSAPKPFCAP